jgi:pteridine reductase
MNTPRVALVTGSGKRRLGWHIADALARRRYSLVVHYRSSAHEAEQAVTHFGSHGVEAVAVQADLTHDDDIERLFTVVRDRFGRLDVLVNCAAIWQAKPLEDVTAEDVRSHFNTNVLASFLCARRAGLIMTAQSEGGCIINFGDWAEVRPYTDYAAYFASKGAVSSLTRSLAVELGTRNPRVRVNCIQPGPVMLPEDMPEERRRRVIEATLVKREGRPENIVQAVLFLIDNDFVTGVCLPIDGGRSVFAPTS